MEEPIAYAGFAGGPLYLSPAQLEQHESPKTENKDNQSSCLLDESTPA